MRPLPKALLICGILSSLYYVGMNLYVPTRWDGYSLLSNVPSELSAIDAPTRPLWVRMAIPYTLLVLAFGVGVWLSAGEDRALRVVGGLFVANGALGIWWPPMHLRGAGTSLTDTLHIVWTAVWLVTMLASMGLAGSALGPRFRRYTAVTLAAFLVFGTLTALEAPRLAADLPTPWIGLWERLNIAVAMLWIAVLGLALVRRPTPPRAP